MEIKFIIIKVNTDGELVHQYIEEFSTYEEASVEIENNLLPGIYQINKIFIKE